MFILENLKTKLCLYCYFLPYDDHYLVLCNLEKNEILDLYFIAVMKKRVVVIQYCKLYTFYLV